MELESVILQEELVIEIMLRLPVKSLIRFKCVCKSWLSIISNPQFGKSHFDFALAPIQRLLLLHGYTDEIVSFDFNTPSFHDDSTSFKLKVNFPLPQLSHCSPLEIIDSCRGFILLRCYPDLYVWNPCNGFHKQLPQSPIICYSMDDPFDPFILGFGYDPSTDDYLVTVASYSHDDREVIRAQIFSTRADKWIKVEGTHLSYLNNCIDHIDHGMFGLYFNGAIHWLAYPCGRPVAGVIVAFDLKERVFFEIALPNDLYDQASHRLRVLKRFLCLCNEPIIESKKIWVMEEYKVQSSWTRNHFVYPTNFSFGFFPMCFTNNGDIVVTDGSSGLVKINDKGDVLEHLAFDDHKEYRVVMHSESLLSFHCDS